MFKFLRVDMNSGILNYEDIKESYIYFGGRGLVAKLLNDEIDPNIDPLGPENKLIFCIGLLAGTGVTSTDRLSVGAKSPLTGTIKEANAGGIAGRMLARLGIRAIVVEGKAADWSILRIGPDKAELIPATQYAGMNNYDLVAALRELYGKKVGFVSIGGAGERGYLNSSVQVTDREGRPCRAAARGGLGAVMGSKKLKAIVLEPAATDVSYIDYADKEKFNFAKRAFAKAVRAHGFSGKVLPALGTAALVNVINSMGGLPTRNFSGGSFEAAEQIMGERLAQLQSERGGKVGHPCMPGCVIGCSNVYHDADGNYLTAGFEYETIGLNGSNCGISDLDTIARIDRLCDDFGLDTMETGTTIAVCMEAGKLSFGDAKGALDLIQEMIKGTEFGHLLGEGTERAGARLGVKRLPTVKGQSMAAYDPRVLKSAGVTYATSPMGADHTAGVTIEPGKKEGQVEASRTAQVSNATFDSLGMCIFAGSCAHDPVNAGYLLEMMSGLYGGEWSRERLWGVGVETILLEKAFNAKAGIATEDDRLPSYFYTEPLPPTNSVFDLTEEEVAGALSLETK